MVNMRKLVLFMHVSLDGLVAGPKGELKWITVDDDIFEFAGQRTNSADTALYGRVTYEMMQAYWPTAGDQPNASKHDLEHSKWYNSVEKIVFSKSLMGKNLPRTTFIGGDLKSAIDKLKNKKGRDILMFGSPGAARSLMQLDLIDEYWLFVNPLLLGVGIPLFGGLRESLKLKLTASHVFSSGVVCLNYARN
jgi:dihydrofolate reductase